MVHPDERSQLTATERLFVSLQEEMMELHNNEDTFDEAIDMAEQLLLQPYLPLLARAKCHLVLSCDPEPPEDAVAHAREAVRLLNEDVRRLAQDRGAPFPQEMYREAMRLLHEAENDLAEDALAAREKTVLDTVEDQDSATEDTNKMDANDDLADKVSLTSSLTDTPAVQKDAHDTVMITKAVDELNLSSASIGQSSSPPPLSTQDVPSTAVRSIGTDTDDLICVRSIGTDTNDLNR